jgi:hypothetical protein
MNRFSQVLLAVCAVSLVTIAILITANTIQDMRGSSGEVGAAEASKACELWNEVAADRELLTAWDAGGKPKSAANATDEIDLAITIVQDTQDSIDEQLVAAMAVNTYWTQWVTAVNAYIPAAIAFPVNFYDDDDWQTVRNSADAEDQINALCAELAPSDSETQR